MPSSRNLVAAAAVCAALLVAGAPRTSAAPATDDRGFVDSTARCSAPDAVVAFGRTASSRVAVCVDPDGRYGYRGVRVRDGAKLVTSAEPSGDGGFVAENDGVTYSVTASSLVVAVGQRVIRDEPMIDFQKPNSPAEPKPPAEQGPPPAPLPPAEQGPPPAPLPPAEPEPPPAPLPPPLPAEAGAG